MTYDDDFEELDVVLVLYRLLSYVELHQFKIALQSFQPKLLLTKASSVDTPKPTTKAAATSPAKAAVTAAAAAATSAAKLGFTSVASVAMGSAVPKLALDPPKTSKPAVPVAPVAMAQAAEPSRRAVASMAHPYRPPFGAHSWYKIVGFS